MNIMVTKEERKEIIMILKRAGWCLFLIGLSVAIFYHVIEYFIYSTI